MAGTTETSWSGPWHALMAAWGPGPAQAAARCPQAIIRWGGALLELAHFQQGSQANEMIDEAASKFKEALRINPRKHDALWCLGNAYTSQARVALRAQLRRSTTAERCPDPRASCPMRRPGRATSSTRPGTASRKPSPRCASAAAGRASRCGPHAGAHAQVLAGAEQRDLPESPGDDQQGGQGSACLLAA